MAIKSLVTKTLVDTAKKAHNCQANSKHRIERGDSRLKVKNGRSWDHYCAACADKIIGRDIEKLSQLKKLEPSEG